ncbi:MAG: hypothetical protein M3010_02155, partial [Candidatus Dormibacteraeota bacterium]|nr:hypothetical protein [Candidatus Dormibacteraeota bacterium]
MGPTGRGMGGDGLNLTAVCADNPAHTPPVAECECGIHGVENVAGLISYAYAIESKMAYAVQHQCDPGLLRSRAVIVRGVLEDAVPVKGRGGGRLVPLYSDGQRYRVIAPPGVRQVGLAVVGDPPGTWRGSRFTA